MMQENVGNIRHKYALALTGIACAMGVVLFLVATMTVEGQSVEPQASDIPKGMSAQTAARGVDEKGSTTLWDRPVFMGNPNNMGSPYVPMDTWIYPAFDRLIALGFVRSAIVGQRPWTRLECTRL